MVCSSINEPITVFDINILNKLDSARVVFSTEESAGRANNRIVALIVASFSKDDGIENGLNEDIKSLLFCLFQPGGVVKKIVSQ